MAYGGVELMLVGGIVDFLCVRLELGHKFEWFSSALYFSIFLYISINISHVCRPCLFGNVWFISI